MWNSARSVRVWSLAVAALLFVSQSAQAEPFFKGLGNSPGSHFNSTSMSVSADGSVVAGSARILRHMVVAFRWTLDGGRQLLGDLPHGDFISIAYGISDDGSVVVGFGSIPFNSIEAFRSRDGRPMRGLGFFRDTGRGRWSVAHAVSADGSVVVGVADNRAFRWTEEDGMLRIDDLSGGLTRTIGYGLSADGSVVVGERRAIPVTEAFRWTAETGMVGLGSLFPELPRSFSSAADCSDDGSTIVGRSSGPTSPQMFRWTADDGMVGLQAFPGSIDTIPHAISGDAEVIVGAFRTHDYKKKAFIWDDVNGIRLLSQVLIKQGHDLTNWNLTEAMDVSADGLTVVGHGEHPDGSQEGWIATIPKAIAIDIKPGNEINPINPASRGVIPVAILGSDKFDVANIDVTTLAFGPEGASILYRRDEHFRDVNGDGLTDVVSHYRTQETGIAQGDVEACISGETFDGIEFEGCDSIRTFPACGSGFELALLLPGLMWLRQRRQRLPATAA